MNRQRVVLGLLLLVTPTVLEAQFNYKTNNGTIIITEYTGSDERVIIPSTTNGLPVVSIGIEAFYNKTNLTSIMIPISVTNIDDYAFVDCSSLASITIPDSVVRVGAYAFSECSNVLNAIIGNGVKSIGNNAFDSCFSLTTATIGQNVASIEYQAFAFCYRLTNVFFYGNAPSQGGFVFDHDLYVTLSYLPGTTGWSSTFDGLPAGLWTPQVPVNDSHFGLKTNQFGFNVSWASGMVVVVEASSNLANSAWSPLATNTLTGGSLYFRDPQWTNYPGRFYRIRSP